MYAVMLVVETFQLYYGLSLANIHTLSECGVSWVRLVGS
jgi:hypothetical protein